MTYILISRAIYSLGAIVLNSLNGTGQVWLDNVQCRGNETRLIDCPANPIGTSNCGHDEMLQVDCRGTYA